MNKRSVVLNGLLYGNGKVTPVSVSAIEVTLPGTNMKKYTHWELTLDSTGFPDGVYELVAGGEREKLRPHLGRWIAASPI